MKTLKLPVQLLFCLLISPTVFAGNGVLEINQTCATQLGCFEADSPGFPVTINGIAGTSYRLTSDLVIPDVNTNGITINASHIDIDLNGFSIIGVACVGVTTVVDCKPGTGTGIGVANSSALYIGTSVYSGSIIGMGNYGLEFTGNSNSVRGIQARWNRGHGILVGGSSLIINSRSNDNGGDGIQAPFHSIVRDSIVSGNGGNGINVLDGSIVSNNTVSGNELAGILAQNTVKIVGNVSRANTGNGITTQEGCTVQGNSVVSNAGFGMELGNRSMYLDNLVSYNTAGTVTTSGTIVNMGNNSCNGAATCP